MTTISLPRGRIMADIAAFELSQDEIRRLQHPAIGGVILFRRNYQNREQLHQLCQQIKAIRQPELIIAVDHEGGRVQRFIEGFTRLPAMRILGDIWDNDPIAATAIAEQTGWVLATELAACGVDLSFTPVLDLDWGQCAVIGNRSFHRLPEAVGELAIALQRGLNRGGMKACGKHFPGHGFVAGDSHHVLPEDTRQLTELQTADLLPFAQLSQHGMAAVMPAHVVYTAIDPNVAGFSSYWLQKVLRQEMNFDGAIFSDDLTMEGAAAAGDIAQRAQAAIAAGCDIVLVCNRPDLCDQLIDESEKNPNLQALMQPTAKLAQRWQNMANSIGMTSAQNTMLHTEFHAAQQTVATLSSPRDTAGGVMVGEAF